jgi:TP901 family phage tail tape measure protein
MGEGKVKQSDVQEDALFAPTIKSAKELTTVLDIANKELNETVILLDKVAKEANITSQKGINQLIAAKDKMSKATLKADKIEKATLKNSKALQKARLEEIRVQKAREVAVDRFNKKEAIAIKQAQKAKRATLDGANAYKILSKNVNSASARLKRMSAQYGETDKRTIRAQKNFDRLEKKLRGVNNAARDGRRDVGRYGKALEGVKGSAIRLLGALGLMGGGLAAFRKVGNVIVDFNKAQTDLAAISQRSTEDLKKFEDQARKLGGTTQFTATEITGLQLELAKLGFETNEILNSTGGISNFAAATGVEIPRAAKVAGSALRAFGLDASEIDRVVSTLGVATTKSALDFGFLETALSTVAPVASAMGFSIEDTTALLSQLADSGFDASSSATATRNILLNLADANGELAKELGRPIKSADDLAGALQELDAKGIDLAKSLELTDKRSVAAFNTFLNGADTLSKTKDGITDVNDELEKMAKDRLDSVAGQWALFTSKMEEYILGAADATDATEKLKGFIKSLTDNLEFILGTIGRLVSVFVIYKTRLFAMNIAQKLFSDGAGKMSFKLKTVTKNLKNGSKESKGFGKNLKGIGWAVAIGLAIEFANALIDVATGADVAERELASFQARQEGFQKNTDKNIKVLNDLIEAEKKRLELAIASGEINEEQAAKQFEAFIKLDKASKDLVGFQEYDPISGKVIDSFVDLEAKVASLIEQEKRRITISQSGIRQFEAEGKFKNRLLIAEEKATIRLSKESLKSLRDFRGELKNEQFQAEVSTKTFEKFSRAIGKGNIEREKQLKLIKDVQGVLDEGQTLEDIESEEIEQENEVIQSLLNERLTFINDQERLRNLTAKEAAEQRTIAELEALLEQKKILELYGRDVIDIDLQISQARLGLVGKVQDETIESEKKHLDELLELRKKAFDKLDEFAQKALDKEIEKSKKKQELLDEEISNSQTLEDRLRESAANGNAIASESLAAQSDITEEKQREKIKEAKRQERIEELKALWQTLNTFLNQGDNPLVAGGKAIGVVAGFKSLFSGIAGFFKGTKGRLKDEHKAQMSGRDGHVVRVDGDEAILTGDKMDRLAAAGLTSTNDIVNSAIMNQQLVGVPMANHIDDRAGRSGGDNTELIKEIRNLETAIKNNKPASLHPVFKRGLLNAVVEKELKDGKVTRNWTYK